MKPQPCFETSKPLEEAARAAEERKNRAIDNLSAKLGLGSRFMQTMSEVMDKRTLQEKGK